MDVDSTEEFRDDANPRPLRLGVVAFQTANRANGGIVSLENMLLGLSDVEVCAFTNPGPRVDRWADAFRSLEVSGEGHAWKRTDGPRWKRLLRKFGAVIRHNRRVFHAVARDEIRVWHCNDLGAVMATAPAVRVRGGKVIFNIRGAAAIGGFRWRLARVLVDDIIVLSSHMKEEVELRMPALIPFRGAVVHPIYSVVDFARMCPVTLPERAALRSSLGLEPDAICGGGVGAFMPRKNQLALIESIAAAGAELPSSVQFYFVGDCKPESDPYAAACVQAIAELGLESRVHIVGYSEAIEQWYQAMDFSLCVSASEGLARCMIESLACGVPMISFAVCSAREILEDHSCGEVLEVGDFSGLMTRLTAWLKIPKETAEMGARGARLARKLFEGDQVSGQYAAVYRADRNAAD